MAQPRLASQKGIQARRRGWREMGRGRASGASWLYMFGGGIGAFFAGLIFALYLPDLPEGAPPIELLTGVLLAPLGAYLGNVMGSRASSYYDGMVLIVANERRSRIRKQMATGMSWCFVPKDLVAHRAQDWRYVDGRPYLWLMLPYGQRVHGNLKGTVDYLGLENDPWRARDAAVYARRTWNRMITQSGDDFEVLDEPPEQSKTIEVIGPWIGAAVIVGGGFLMLIMNMD